MAKPKGAPSLSLMSVAEAPIPPAQPDVPLRPLTRVQMYTIALGIVSMGVGMTISFVVAAPLARDAGLTELEVAGVLTLSAFFYAYLTPFWGRLANRFGRKRVMVFSLYMMALTNAAFILALDAALKGVVVGLGAFLLLVVTRLAFGLLSPGLQPAALASMTDATTMHNRASGMGLIGAAMSVGSILGPAAAAILAEFGPLAPIWGAVIFSVIVGTIIAFVLPPTRKGPASARPAPLKMTDVRVRGHLLFLFCYFVAVGIMQQTLAWLVKDRYDLGQSGAVQMTGIVFAAMAVALVITQFGYVARRKPDPRKMLPVGLGLVGVGYLLALISGSLPAMAVSFAVVGLGSALTVPAGNALATLAVTPPEQGAAAALVAAAPPAGFVIGPLFGAGLYMVSHILPLAVSSAVMFALLVYAVMFVLRQPLTSR